MKIWTCKIGEIPPGLLPPHGDLPMRRAVEAAYHHLTGVSPDFIFSGWGGELDAGERAVVDKKSPPVSTFFHRLLVESRELEERKEKLATFITSSPAFLKLTIEQRGMMERQFKAMTEYAAILGERIAAVPADQRKEFDDTAPVEGEIKTTGGNHSEEPVPFRED